MSSSAGQILKVKVGDLVYGIAAGGQEKLLLVYEADEGGFSARHVLSQTNLKFGPDGQSVWVHDGGSCTIVSIAQPPQDLYDMARRLDRKFAAQPEYPDSIMSKAEIQFVLKHDEFFKAHLLPGAEPIVKWAEKINGVRKILQLEWDPVNERNNPPAWNEYLGDLPALVELLDETVSMAEVRAHLIDMAARAGRTRQVGQRGEAAAASLIRLRQSWT